MTGNSCEVGSKEARPALCDMTNLPSKRGISSMLGDYLLKSGDESGKNVVREDQGVKFSKRLCLVVEDLVKENSRGSDSKAGSSSFEDKSSSGGSPLNGGSVNIELVAGKDPGDSKDASDALDVAGVQSFKGDSDDAAVEITGGDGHELKESCISSSSVQVSLENVEKKDHGPASNVASNAKKCTEGEGLPNSQNCRSFEMGRCSTVDRMEHVNHDMGTDMLKSCTCSFCLKAAYIWSDLHYQDIKGRLSVLKKSQKEASNLIQRNSRGKPIDFHGSANSTSSAKLESDLMSQWRSLFLNMGDILSRESNHLQKSFVTMKELRDNCKMDLERSTKTPQH